MSFIDIPAPHGILEGLLWEQEAPKAIAVVCHPHPKGGGTLHNHVTYRIAQALRDEGLSVLRFNFRGVGRSTGTFDNGVGEVADLEAVVNYAVPLVPVPLVVAGFSFGSRIALQIATADTRVARILLVGLATSLFDYTALSTLKIPKAIVQADQDEYGSLLEVQQLVSKCVEPKKLFVVPDCTHLAPGRLDAFLGVAKTATYWLMEV